MAVEMCEVEVWILVDEEGNAVADCDPAHLQDEYETDIGEFDVTKATRLVKVTVRVPLPKPIQLQAVAVAEDETGEAVAV